MVCVCVFVLVAQSCPTMCNLMDCSLPGSCAHGILQEWRKMKWVAIPFCRGHSQSKDQVQVSYPTGRVFTIWATREAQWWHRGWQQQNMLLPKYGSLAHWTLETERFWGNDRSRKVSDLSPSSSESGHKTLLWEMISLYLCQESSSFSLSCLPFSVPL